MVDRSYVQLNALITVDISVSVVYMTASEIVLLNAESLVKYHGLVVLSVT
jgi:hypothetical protein